MGASSSKEVQRNNTFEVPRRVASKSCATKSKKSVHKVNAVHDFIVEPTEIFTYESMRTPSKSCLSSTSRKLSSNSTVDSFKPTRRASVDLYDLRRNSRRASQEIGDRERCDSSSKQ